MKCGRMEEYLVEKGDRKKYIREERKKLLRKARNRHILHMPME
jgi:hypothetical protein